MLRRHGTCTGRRSSRSSRAPNTLQTRLRGNVWDEVLNWRPTPRVPQRPGHRARPHRHDQFYDGLRHDGHRAGHRPWSNTSNWPAAACSRSSTRPYPTALEDVWDTPTRRKSSRSSPTSNSGGTRSKGRSDLKDRAPARLRLCVPRRRTARAAFPWRGPRPDDGRGPRRSSPGPSPRRSTCRPRQTTVEDVEKAYVGRVATRPESPGHLPRRLQGRRNR